MNPPWVRPSKIQASVLPLVLNPSSQEHYLQNVVGQAHHGSGKTGAFVLNTLQRIELGKHRLQALIICHSRELATQTKAVVIQLGRYMQGLECVLAVPAVEQTDRMPSHDKWSAQVCVGTPGVILFHVLGFDGQSRSRFNLQRFLNDFKVLVVDEADELYVI